VLVGIMCRPRTLPPATALRSWGDATTATHNQTRQDGWGNSAAYGRVRPAVVAAYVCNAL